MWRKLGIALGVVVLGGCVWLGYMFRAATRLPDWYQPNADTEAEDPADGLAGWVLIPEVDVQSSEGDRPTAAPARARRRQLRNFHLRSAAGAPATREAIRASRATFEDGHLDAGVVMNVSKIDLKQLGDTDREFYERTLKAFPGLRGRDVYIGIQDEPTSAGGYLQLGADTRVRVGDLDYSLSRVARKLGLSESRVRRQINAEFVRLKITDPDPSAAIDAENPG